mmetsp:Transcript_23217/g.37269  ORF Transcript_23217/g.37269 Transcript_23217/m.37269 type:complete len:711 (-) Transcript_23217:228-2360(-)|eukprot:CAMPEP_0179415568 /NCGR_PEP_ID=MMETSP0799-20121207/6303_1 /TAXON_ID=46947 /ORGANISM="Geminigera cryophila, Strain CCMP2564" /LENGTH=710 /DNA_ID=CAMNT_0021188319 /DNA_START=32 /DNA_END=2164 /DNA_ORIENTATION=+
MGTSPRDDELTEAQDASQTVVKPQTPPCTGIVKNTELYTLSPERFTGTIVGLVSESSKVVFKALSNIEPAEQTSFISERTATYTESSLNPTTVLDVVHKTGARVSETVQNTRAQTTENTTAFVDYSKRVWKISNWWRSPPQAVSRGSRPKLLIVYSDTGGGHKASATAICAAFEHLVPGQIEVKAVDVIEQYSLWPSNRTYSFFTSYPWLWGMIYKTTKQTHSLGTGAQASHTAAAHAAAEAQGCATQRTEEVKKRISTQLADASARYTETPSSTFANYLFDPAVSLEPYILEGFIRCIQEERPDMIMSVHPILQCTPRATSSHLKDGRKIPFVTVVTDLGEAHPWWFNKGLNLLFVPTQVMKEQGIELGLSADNIRVCGLPLRQMFWHVDTSDERKLQLRHELGLDALRPVVLLMGGGDGMGKLQESSQSFIQLLATVKDGPPEEDMQVVIVCGKNEVLQRTLKNAIDKAQKSTDKELAIKVLGFVSNVDEWMVTSDILVTKAGPGTIAEACCCEKPILVFDYLPGQEEGNVSFVVDMGMGEHETVASSVAHRCLSWLKDPAKMAEFKKAAKEQAQPTSAIDIARQTLEILQEEARLNEEETEADVANVGGDGEKAADALSTLHKSGSAGSLAGEGVTRREGFGDHSEGGVKYKYVYKTAWWSWLSPFNHERAPSWWRESRVQDTDTDTCNGPVKKDPEKDPTDAAILL